MSSFSNSTCSIGSPFTPVKTLASIGFMTDVGRPSVPGSPLGIFIRDARAVLGWSQEDLAEAAEVSQETVSAIERGATIIPQPKTMRRLAEALRVDMADMVIASNQARTRSDARRVMESAPEYSVDTDSFTARVCALLERMDHEQQESVLNFARYVLGTKPKARRRVMPARETA